LSEDLKDIYFKNEIFVKKTVLALFDAVMSLGGGGGPKNLEFGWVPNPGGSKNL